MDSQQHGTAVRYFLPARSPVQGENSHRLPLNSRTFRISWVQNVLIMRSLLLPLHGVHDSPDAVNICLQLLL